MAIKSSLIFGTEIQTRVLLPLQQNFDCMKTDPIGITSKHPNPRSSIRWWMGPLRLSAHTQMARVEFDPKRFQIDGDYGGGVDNEIVIGRTYLLTLNVAVVGTQSRLAEIQQQIPLVRFVAGDASKAPEALSGIVNIRRPMESSGLAHEYSSKIGWETDRTPMIETLDVSR